jgi:hypothetical protein
MSGDKKYNIPSIDHMNDELRRLRARIDTIRIIIDTCEKEVDSILVDDSTADKENIEQNTE